MMLVRNAKASSLAERLAERLGGKLAQGAVRAAISGIVVLAGQRVVAGHGLQQFLHHLRFELVGRTHQPRAAVRGVAVPSLAATPKLAASEHLQVGLQRAGLFHRLQDRDHVARSRSGPLQFLDQIFDRRALFQIDAVDGLVLGLNVVCCTTWVVPADRGPGCETRWSRSH